MTDLKINSETVQIDDDFLKNKNTNDFTIKNNITYYNNTIATKLICDNNDYKCHTYFIDSNIYNLKKNNLISINNRNYKENTTIKNYELTKYKCYHELLQLISNDLIINYYFPKNTLMQYHCWLVNEINKNELFYCFLLNTNVILISLDAIDIVKNNIWSIDEDTYIHVYDDDYNHFHTKIAKNTQNNIDDKKYPYVIHKNNNIFDNRNDNLKYVSTIPNNTIKNIFENKKSRRSDAIQLPNDIHEHNLPKYTYYKTEKRNNNTLEYFAIRNHPKCKSWVTSKSIKIPSKEKLKQLHEKILELNN